MIEERGLFVPGLAFAGAGPYFFAAWERSPAGAYAELIDFGAAGRPVLTCDPPAGAAVVRRIHRIASDRPGTIFVVRRSGRLEITVDWADGGRLELSWRPAGSLATRFASAVLRRLPEQMARWRPLLAAAAAAAGPLAGGGPIRLAGRTDTGVPIRCRPHRIELAGDVRGVLDGRPLGAPIRPPAGRAAGDLVFARRPLAIDLTLILDEESP